MKIRAKFVFFTFSIFFLLFFFFAVLGTFLYFFATNVFFWIIFLGLHYLICVILIIFVIFNKWDLQYSLTVIISVVLVPYLGLFAFFIIGRRRSMALKLYRWEKNYLNFSKLMKFSHSPDINSNLKIKSFAKFSANFSVFPFSNHNNIKIFNHPIAKIRSLHADLKKAQKYIYFNFYIFSDGQYLEILKRLLIEKLKQGIEVRIIYDGFGTATHSTHSFTIPLIKNGAILKSFGTISPFLPNILDRNHRKDVIIDGKIAYTGGSNIGDEYLNLNPKYGYFADLDVRLTGDVVRDIEMIFWKDWMICTGENLFSPKLKPILNRLANQNQKQKLINSNTKTWIQVTDDSPTHNISVNRDIFFNLFTKAQKRIWLTSPYFYIDNEINKALINAALNGVDVRIILHNFAGFKFLVNLSRLHYDELLKAGVKIYEFSNAYLHSKLIIIDNDFLSIGTTNIDFTSFYYCYQTTLLIFSQRLNNQICQTFLTKIFANSLQINTNPLHKFNRIYIWFLKFMQIFIVFL